VLNKKPKLTTFSLKESTKTALEKINYKS